MFRELDIRTFREAAHARLLLAVFKAVEANDVAALQSLATKDYAGKLAATKKLWVAFSGDSEVRRLRVVGTDGDYMMAEKSSMGMSFSVSWQTSAGVWSKPERCYYWFERENNAWRLAGIRGIGEPSEAGE